MEEKHFLVTYYLANGEKRVVSDVVATDTEAAMLKAPKSITRENIELEIKSGHHRISVDHIVEIVAKEVPSPEERKKNQEKNLNALNGLRF